MIKHEDEPKNLPAFALLADIKDRNERYFDNFDTATVLRAEEIRELADATYTRSNVYLNFRKHRIVVKVESVMREDKIQRHREIVVLEELIDKYNCTVRDLSGHLLINLTDGDLDD